MLNVHIIQKGQRFESSKAQKTPNPIFIGLGVFLYIYRLIGKDRPCRFIKPIAKRFTWSVVADMFHLSVGISTLIKADWKLKSNPLGNLGLFLNLAQLIYFPILFLGIIKSPNDAIIFLQLYQGPTFFPMAGFIMLKPFM